MAGRPDSCTVLMAANPSKRCADFISRGISTAQPSAMASSADVSLTQCSAPKLAPREIGQRAPTAARITASTVRTQRTQGNIERGGEDRPDRHHQQGRAGMARQDPAGGPAGIRTARRAGLRMTTSASSRWARAAAQVPGDDAAATTARSRAGRAPRPARRQTRRTGRQTTLIDRHDGVVRTPSASRSGHARRSNR